MARPMSAEDTLRALRKWKVPYRETTGWRTHNRNNVGSFADINGFVIHHTGDDAPDSLDERVIREGRSDLPGPLAQFGGDDKGTILLIGCGRANHAGGGDPAVLEAVRKEKYRTRPPAPRFHTGSPGAADGNSHFYGVETFYSGRKPPTKATYKSLVLLAAAICDHHGWSSKSVIGHREWSDWKPDPGNVDMVKFRRDVAEALKAGPEEEPPDEGRPAETPDDPAHLHRITKARALMRDALDLLEKACKGRPKVAEARDELKAALKTLPDR